MHAPLRGCRPEHATASRGARPISDGASTKRHKRSGAPLVRRPEPSLQTIRVMAFLASVWAQYTNQLVVRPLLTKACTSSTLMSIGDTFTQFVIQQKKPEEYDPQRTARMVRRPIPTCVTLHQAFYGFTTHGPLLHYWYRWLDSRIVVKSTTDVRARRCVVSDFLQLLKKVVVDQAVFAPLLTTVFFGELELLKGTPIRTVPCLLMRDRQDARRGGSPSGARPRAYASHALARVAPRTGVQLQIRRAPTARAVH